MPAGAKRRAINRNVGLSAALPAIARCRQGTDLAIVVALELSEASPTGEKMKASTEDQVKGKFHEVKGDIKERAAKIAGNPGQEAEGRSEKLAGKVQKKVGQIEKVLEK